MRLLFAAFIGVVIATPVCASPVYLHCTMEGAQQGFDVALDEAKGTAAYSLGVSKTVPAVFTMSEVSFHQDIPPVLTMTTTIDRRTLAVTSQSMVSSGLGNTAHGMCKLVTAEANKF